ncbi:MAG: putative NADH dehydrogenase/NAD(P)H nitroreductase [Lysobacteraceae bacterium]|nr:MAG: putative NADH dehydrogenase/NAD(P)H nitroreductase [Xanthomonadaceae bacterium]
MLDQAALDLLFHKGRTFRGSAEAWQDRPVEEATLRRLWELTALPPTSANCSPARIVFVQGREAKEKLCTALDEGNVAATMAAPVTAIVAHDLAFHEKLPYLFPFADAKAWFEGNEAKIRETAFRNGSLQGAYLILAARALGLDCGPMSGFDAARVDALFLAGTRWKSNFLVNLGYGNPATLGPRAPRLDFDEACRIV